EEAAAWLVQKFLQLRCVADDGHISLVLAVEDPQRIAVEPRAAVRRQSVEVLAQVLDESLAIRTAALLVAERVHFEDRVPQHAQLLQDMRARRDDLDIAERLGHADKLDPDLVKLPVSPLLR